MNIPQPDFAPICSFLKAVHVAGAQTAGALTLTPLVLGAASPPAPFGYIPLSEGIDRGDVTVSEVGPNGSVPNVRIRNDGAVSVLFLFGQEIVGAKQNRVANASFVVGAHSDSVVDVSCVEAGRWGGRGSERFERTEGVVSQELRRKMALSVSRGRACDSGFPADQLEVWSEVAERIRCWGTRSTTGAYADYVKERSAAMRALEHSFTCVERQVGFVASIAGRIAGVEIIGRPEVFERLFSSLLRGHLVDAVDVELMQRQAGEKTAQAMGPESESPAAFLEALAQSDTSSGASLGLGVDVRLHGPVAQGCALVCDGLVHLSAFPRAA